MHRTTRRLLPSTMIATAALTVAAALAPAAASAQAPGATVASATSSPSEGMKYLGGSANNDVCIRLASTTFTIDDVVPIQAGAGCTPVTGDTTKVLEAEDHRADARARHLSRQLQAHGWKVDQIVGTDDDDDIAL
jgi:hypothetical protein